MPYVTRRITLAQCLSEVLVAPFAFLLVGVVAHWWVLLATLACVALCVGIDLLSGNFNGRDWLGWFSPRTGLIWLGVVGTLWAAAGLLTVRDLIRTGGRQRVWDDGCLELARRFAGLVAAGDLGAAYLLASRSLGRLSPAEFEAAHLAAWQAFGVPRSVLRAEEVIPGRRDLPLESATFPGDVAEAERRAVVAVTLSVSSGPARACGLHLCVCAEGGEDRVASFEYREADEEALP